MHRAKWDVCLSEYLLGNLCNRQCAIPQEKSEFGFATWIWRGFLLATGAVLLSKS
jgi:hypothetical protein